jgi:hypothetical protein
LPLAVAEPALKPVRVVATETVAAAPFFKPVTVTKPLLLTDTLPADAINFHVNALL